MCKENTLHDKRNAGRINSLGFYGTKAYPSNEYSCAMRRYSEVTNKTDI